MFLYIKFRFRKKFNLRNENVRDMPNEFICISFFKGCLYTHNCGSNMRYAYFMLIIDISKYFLLDDDDVSCVPGVMGITGLPIITQDKKK